ncbi:calpain-D [Cladorrhinum sp. PSN259]|nr:calpain-D [Cladorrhinum sp. PSN259]
MHGYSSDSETDDEYNYRKYKGTVVAQSSSTDANKKLKKRRWPPQQNINRIWKRFSNKRFNKALAVLPFDPVLPPTISDRSNELIDAGFQRAADECRRKVQKIIQECRRVNMRYRDPGWDIDWDLKMEKGHCLNSLGRTKFDISMSNLLNPSSSIPKAVKRIHEIFDKPTFMNNLSGSDVKQGSLGDCWLMASLTGLANVEDGIKRLCVVYDTRIGIYGFVFYRDGEWIYSIIDDKLYLKSPCWDSPSMHRDLLQQVDREDAERVYRRTYQTGSKALFFAQCKDQNETWVPLIEKAYAKAHGDYASLSGGWIGEGLEDLSGGVTTELLASDILDLDAFWTDELSRVNEEFLFGCSTGLLDGGYGDRDGITEGHAYNIMEARTLKNGTRLVKLRNPWGKNRKGIWEGAWSDGSKEWTTEVQEELGHQFGSDSVFWISYDDLLRKYQHFDRTRLFREKDWRSCQRWIGVDVPWKPQYNEKFHIKLTKEGPLVIVLSQLDNRYFKGLHGQYSFRLQFRVHEQNRPNPEDYIVRSHGNYLMDRSVAIELPCMLPGNYSVFISVAGERDTTEPSIESVVKRECKKRVENEKLVQVGYAYDLAHSKATAHLEAVRALRKKADQKKASEARVKERRRNWEKRHLNRDVTKKQGRKNNAKLEARQAAREAKKRREEELKPKDAGVQTEEPSKEEKAEVKEDAAKVDEKPKDDKASESTEQNSEVKEDTTKADDKTKEAEAKVDDASKAKDAAASDAKDEKPADKTDASPVSKEDDSDDDDEDTPIGTPAETPTVEKTQGQASGDSDDKAEDKEESAGNSEDSTKKADGNADSKSDDKSEEKPVEDNKDATASVASSDSSGSPQLTPKSEASVPHTDDKEKEKEPAPSDSSSSSSKVSGGPPPPPPPPPATSTQNQPSSSSAPKPKAANRYVTSDGESSASPVEDWEELYSSDDMTRKPRMAPQPAAGQAAAAKYRDDTDDENDPDPWNAICVVGLRVYSKDEGLELRVVMEGGELEEGGMGEKGGVDLDNAQANAGGMRREKEDEAEYEGDSEDQKKKDRKKRRKSRGKKSSGTESGSASSESEKEDEKKEEPKEVEKKEKGKEKEVNDGMASYPVFVQKGVRGDEEYETAVETIDN